MAIELEIIVKKVYKFIAWFRRENGISVFSLNAPNRTFPETYKKYG
jgi:hypothetical protein